MNRVQEEIHGSTAASQEWTPPPVIILQINKSLKLRGIELFRRKKVCARRCAHLDNFSPHDARQDVLTLKFVVSIFDSSIFRFATAEWQRNFAFTNLHQFATLLPLVKFCTYFLVYRFPPNPHWNFKTIPVSFHDLKREMWRNSFALRLYIFHVNGIQIQI